MSVYKVIELVGSSEKSWEDAACTAVSTASKHLRDLRIAEVEKMDMHIGDDGKCNFRIRLKVSFKYHTEE